MSDYLKLLEESPEARELAAELLDHLSLAGYCSQDSMFEILRIIAKSEDLSDASPKERSNLSYACYQAAETDKLLTDGLERLWKIDEKFKAESSPRLSELKEMENTISEATAIIKEAKQAERMRMH